MFSRFSFLLLSLCRCVAVAFPQRMNGDTRFAIPGWISSWQRHRDSWNVTRPKRVYLNRLVYSSVVPEAQWRYTMVVIEGREQRTRTRRLTVPACLRIYLFLSDIQLAEGLVLYRRHWKLYPLFWIELCLSYVTQTPRAYVRLGPFRCAGFQDSGLGIFDQDFL